MTNPFDPFDEPFRRLLEEQERMRRLFEPEPSLRDILRQHHVLENPLAPQRGLAELVEEICNQQFPPVEDGLRGTLEALGDYRDANRLLADAFSERAEEQLRLVTGLNAFTRTLEERAAFSESLATVASAVLQSDAQLPFLPDARTRNLLSDNYANELARVGLEIGSPAIEAALLGERYAALAAFAPPSYDSIGSLAAIIKETNSLSDMASLAQITIATSALANVFCSERLIGAEYDLYTDAFIGDWTRIDDLPERYSSDDGVRREILEETGADESFLHISTEDASAIVRTTSTSSDGAPLVIMGQPVGIWLERDPAEVAFTVLKALEVEYRKRVHKMMSSAYGDNWLEEKEPDLAKEWSVKKQEDERDNLPEHSIIHYSTFFELNHIVLKHWEPVFRIENKKPKDIIRPFSALNPHRRHTMHSRTVTPEQLMQIIYNAVKAQAWLNETDAED